MTNRYLVIGRSSCPFCVFAVDYCAAKKIECVFLDYAKNTEIIEEYKEYYKQETVPIILSNNLITGLTKKIGGYSDLLDHLK